MYRICQPYTSETVVEPATGREWLSQFKIIKEGLGPSLNEGPPYIPVT